MIDGQIIVHTNQSMSIGIGVTANDIVETAYSANRRIIFNTEMPKGLYDFFVNLPHGGFPALQDEIKRQFGITGKWMPTETNVLVLKLAESVARGFKPAGSLMKELNLNINSLGGPMMYELGDARKDENKRSSDVFYETKYRFNTTLAIFINKNGLKNIFDLPIIDETGLTNRYDFVTTFVFNIPKKGGFGNPDQEMWRKVLKEQLGLELIPAQRPVEFLVVEKMK